jgi:thioredoxin 1
LAFSSRSRFLTSLRAPPAPPLSIDAVDTTMDASTIDTFVGDYWDRFAAYWNTIPSHVRIIIMFLITRIIARALTPKPPTKKGAVKEIASLAEYQSRIAHAGNVKGKITVVDYTAVWCGPCRAIAPRFADLSVRYADVDFLKVDVDKVKGASKEADIRCYPTFQFFKGGEKVDTVEGADAAKLEQTLKTLGAVERRLPDPDDSADQDAAKKDK